MLTSWDCQFPQERYPKTTIIVFNIAGYRNVKKRRAPAEGLSFHINFSSRVNVRQKS